MRRPDIDRMAREMTVQDLMAWRAFFRYRPMPEKRADWRAAQVAAMVHNVMMAVFVKNGPQKDMADLLLRFEPPKQKSPSMIFQAIKMNLLVHGNLEF